MKLKNNVINLGIIGLGARGTGLLKSVILPMKGIHICAINDVHEDRCIEAENLILDHSNYKPNSYKDYKEMFDKENLDAVLISCSWAGHIDMAIAAMEIGIYVACEVGGAYSIHDCWRLVEAYERTKTPCMLMENCCYGRDELMVLNMIHQGVLGEVVHCSGGYHHDLRNEVSYGYENRHYRLDNYLNRNCENYPTHELGPIAMALDINRGNRLLSLTSVASKAAGLNAYIIENKGSDSALAKEPVMQGDIVTTIIKCAKGQTISLTLDTTLPRYYSRGFQVRGTKGMYFEDNHSIFLDGVHNENDFDWKKQWGNVEKFRAQYEHPIWEQYLAMGIKGGHDGMDWLVFSDFFHCVREGKEPKINVYDMAVWMSITTLSEESIAMGGHPVAIPDFTNGKWVTNHEKFEPKDFLES